MREKNKDRQEKKTDQNVWNFKTSSSRQKLAYLLQETYWRAYLLGKGVR